MDTTTSATEEQRGSEKKRKIFFEKLPKFNRVKKLGLKSSLEYEYDCILEELKIDPESKLTQNNIRRIIEILGLELSSYQRSELNNVVSRAHYFNGNSLKQWLSKNKSFILSKYAKITLKPYKDEKRIGSKIKISLNKSLNDIVLPKIRINSQINLHDRKSFKNNIFIDKRMRNFTNSKTDESNYCKRIEEKFGKYLRNQQESFKDNMEWIAFIRKQCLQIKYFKKLLMN